MLAESAGLFDLTGRVAVVTGSSAGIGRAIVSRMAEHGARVVISGRREAECRKRADELNERHGAGRAIAVACDIGNRADIRRLVEESLSAFGRIDCAVGNAVSPGAPQAWIEKLDIDHFTWWFEANVTNNAYLAQLVTPVMRSQGGGTILYTASTAGVAAMEDQLGYGSCKAALVHLTRMLAVQLGPHNIRVNAIAPGIVASSGIGEGQWATEEARLAGVGGTPLGRVGLPDEIAACAVWLAGPAGEFATGATVVIDGGQSWKGMDGPHRLRTQMREQQADTTETRDER